MEDNTGLILGGGGSVKEGIGKIGKVSLIKSYLNVL